MIYIAPPTPRTEPRCGVHVLRPNKRLPRPTLFGYGVLLALLLLSGGSAWLLAPAHAEEPAREERYVPVSRSSRFETERVQQWRPLVESYAWDAETALRVLACESEGSPTAVNPSSGATGLYQLLGWSWLAGRLTGSWDLTNAWVNVRTAFALWLDSGERFGFHWAASAGCWRL